MVIVGQGTGGEGKIKALYYWWFQYLLRSEPFCFVCERNGEEGDRDVKRVYADVGDIRHVNFDDWWELTGRALALGKPSIGNISELVDTTGVLDVTALTKLWTSGDYLIPIIKRGTKWGVIKTGLVYAEELATLRQPLAPPRVLKARPFEKLQKWLEVWDIKKQHPEWTTDKIAADAHIAVPGDRRGSQLRVARYLRIAQQLIDNAAVGKFAEFEKY